MKTLLLTGFGQSDIQFKGFFETKLKGEFEICPYHNFGNYKQLRNAIELKHYERIIGWSLGGQIACRLIADKAITTDFLFLISAPYQFVSKNNDEIGVDNFLFNCFKAGFMQDKDFWLKNLAKLMDSKIELETQENRFFLDYWLEELENFSCSCINFSNFPKTFYLAGGDDNVVNPSQVNYFFGKIKNFRSIKLENSGHTPHYDFFK